MVGSLRDLLQRGRSRFGGVQNVNTVGSLSGKKIHNYELKIRYQALECMQMKGSEV